ncbi:hypothetical protein C5167_030757 [Papaver somniferum]|nr:hypothetical protein C5167_030757 [Papaver somniferum]
MVHEIFSGRVILYCFDRVPTSFLLMVHQRWLRKKKGLMVVTMPSANSPVLQTTTLAEQDPAFLTLKDFHLRNGVGSWVTRVSITRMWDEVDFMRTNEVTSLDFLLLDDSARLRFPQPMRPKFTSDVDLPEVLHIKQRSSHRTLPREITLPSRVGYYQANQSIADNRKSLSELFKIKWESGYNVLNKKMCRAKALGISTEKGWYYLGRHNYTTKLVGNTGHH